MYDSLRDQVDGAGSTALQLVDVNAEAEMGSWLLVLQVLPCQIDVPLPLLLLFAHDAGGIRTAHRHGRTLLLQKPRVADCSMIAQDHTVVSVHCPRTSTEGQSVLFRAARVGRPAVSADTNRDWWLGWQASGRLIAHNTALHSQWRPGGEVCRWPSASPRAARGPLSGCVCLEQAANAHRAGLRGVCGSDVAMGSCICASMAWYSSPQTGLPWSWTKGATLTASTSTI